VRRIIVYLKFKNLKLLKKLSSTLVFALLATLLLFVAGKCFGQDSTSKKAISFPLHRNILLVESTQTNAWFPPRPGYFRVRYKVKVVSGDSGNIDKGHIQYICDSSIFINGKEIKLSDIHSIKKVRGEVLSIGGGSLTAIGLAFSVIYGSKAWAIDTYSDHSYEGAFLGSVIGTMAAGILTLVGVIKMASAHNYYMDDGWRFDVKPDIPVQGGMMKFPGKSDTVKGNQMFLPGNNMNMPNPFPGKKKKVEDK
jgi:hypothetical protein